MVVCNDKFVRKSLIKFRSLLMDIVNHRATRTTSERNMKPRELRIRADRVDFHSAIAQIAHVSGKTQALRNVLREIPESHSLHYA